MSKEQNADKIVNIEHATTVIISNANVTVPGQQSALPEKERFITDSRKPLYILDDYKDDDKVEYPPTKLFYRSLFFFTLHTSQDKYLLLDAIPGNKCSWSVPYTCFQIDTPQESMQTVEEIQSVFYIALLDIDSIQESHENSLFFRLGIKDAHFDTGRRYFEYLPPTEESAEATCIYNCEYFLHDVDPAYIKNLADPDCLLQHHYLPFHLADRLPKEDDSFLFLGRPLQFSVSDVLMNCRRKLNDNSIRVAKQNMVQQCEGILFRLSITSLQETQLISSILNAALDFCGVSKFCLEGNSVTGVMPHNEKGFSDLLQRLDAGLSQFPDNILVCCTAHRGTFEYGKTLDLASSYPTFAGDAYRQLLCLDLETDFVRRMMPQDSTGILFGWDMEDYLKINRLKFDGRIEYPDKYPTEGNRTMNFIHIMKKVTSRE